MEAQEHLIKQVNELIQTNIDRREGYAKALDDVTDPGLKLLFEQCSRQSDDYINELRPVAIRYGFHPPEAASVASGIYRTWMDVKSALAVNDSKAVLQSCEKGEDMALNAYREVTDDKEGIQDASVADMIHKQQQEIMAMHDKIREKRDNQS